MTAHARRAIVPGRVLVGQVTARALIVPRDAMQPRPLRSGMTARACRWLGDPIRTVRAMTARTVCVLAVTEARLVAVAARAGRRCHALATVGFVTARARLVSLRCRRRLRRVTGRARRWWTLRLVRASGVAVDARLVARVGPRRDRCMAGRAGRGRRRRRVCGGRVTALAGAMARRRDGAGLLGMTLRAQRGRQHGLAGMRRVAIEAASRRVFRLRMAALARDSLLVRSECVRRMTASTRRRGSAGGRRTRMRDLRGVTRAAGPGDAALVGCVTGRAGGVLGRDQHGLVLMTARTRLRLLGGEPVRLVAARALRVTSGDRRERDVAPIRDERRRHSDPARRRVSIPFRRRRVPNRRSSAVGTISCEHRN